MCLGWLPKESSNLSAVALQPFQKPKHCHENGGLPLNACRIVFYLLNLHIKSRHTYFARAGTSREEDSYKTDASLSEQGKEYAKKMSETLIRHREGERRK